MLTSRWGELPAVLHSPTHPTAPHPQPLRPPPLRACHCTNPQHGHHPLQDFNLLAREYASRGLTIVAFPCNQFFKQEPGSNEAIQSFLAARRFRCGILAGSYWMRGGCVVRLQARHASW